MKEIPVVHIKDKTISEVSAANDIGVLLNRLQSSTAYVFDEDGVTKNQPNLSIYQKLSGISDIWLDAGPRGVDDIVDEVFSGANRVVIRPTLWKERNLKEVVDITENELMSFYSIEEVKKGVPNDSMFLESQGIVISFDENIPAVDFKTEGFLKQIAKTKPTYMLDMHMKRKEYWISLGMEGILIPIDMLDV
jgi:uncharacterized protein related to proFAR isomerase